MSKVSFRARALDSNKPLPLYYEEELPDLSEYVAINRTVPQMPTGMEKEEESESHLQKVINAQQNLKDTSNLVIPIPEAAIPVTDHFSIYQPLRYQPHNYIRVPGLGPDEELPDYDLDSEDEEWLSVQSRERPLSHIHFERMMDKLEKGSGNTVLSERDAQVLLKDDEDLVMAVYDYWLAKRLRLSRPLIPSVKNERREGVSSSNPYLAFRKRTEKMQTRKNRKNDEQAYMHMLKLKRDLTRSVTLVELVKEREQRKYDLALIQAEIFRKRYLLQDWSGSLISSLRPHGAPSSSGRRLSTPDNKWDGKGLMIKSDFFEDGDGIITHSTKTKKKRRKGTMYTPALLDHESPLATIALSKSDKELKESDRMGGDTNDERIDVEELDGPFTFRRKVHLHYHKSHSFRSWPWDGTQDDACDKELTHRPKRYCFSYTTLNGRKLGLSRRRVGRGGRTMWDFMPNTLYSESEDELLHDHLSQDELTTEAKEDDSPTGICDTAPSTPSCTPQEPATPGNKREHCQPRCPHFYPVSPKSTKFSDFEFTYLPFVDPSSYSCPELNKGYSQFAGQTLNDEEEGASSFSSLPTSQFTLRPCLNLDQTSEHLLDRSPSDTSAVGDVTGSLPNQQPPQNDHHGVEPVWNKFRQSQNEPKTDSFPSGSGSGSGSISKNNNNLVSSLPVPSTHLSSLESSLPIQIHVDNLTHLPKKDSKLTIPNTSNESTTPSTTVPQSLTPASLHANSTNPSYTNNKDTGLTGQSLPLNNPLPSGEIITWFRDCPSSNMLLLNNRGSLLKSKTNHSSQFRRALPSSIAKSVTARFKAEAKPEPVGLSSIVPNAPLSLSSSSSASSPSSPLPHPLLATQHSISNLIPDAKKLETFVREKKHFVAHPNNSNHQNSSPNGTALELNHSGKLPSDTEKDIKHALAARTVINNHSGLMDSSSSNSLVKLTGGTPPSEVT